MLNRLRRGAIVASLAILAGCSKTESDLPPATAGDGLREMSDAFGALVLECIGVPWQYPAAIVTDVQAAVDSGTLIYSATAKDACLAEIAATTCLGLFHGADLPSCFQGAFSGTVANGGGCGDSVECAAGYCDYATATCPGTCTAFVALNGVCSHLEECAAGLACDGLHCVAPTTVAVGAECGREDLVCAAGSTCVFNFSTWKDECLPIGQSGDACYLFEQCPATLLCDMRNTGTCLDLAPRGASCAAAACNPFTDYCSPATALCTAIPTLGQSCADSGSCTWDSFCDSTGSGTCLALPGLGGDCSVSRITTQDCSGTAYCDYDPVARTGTCVALIDPGGACVDDGTCVAGYYCNAVRPSAGTCVAKKAAGSSCLDYWECQSGLGCLGGTCSIESCY